MSDPESMFAHVYTLLRSSKQKRRPFLRTIINQFTDKVCNAHTHTHNTHTRTHTCAHTVAVYLIAPLSSHCRYPQRNTVSYLLYLADNLAYFPYNTLEEPLFVIHETNMAMAVHGAAVYQGFREVRVCRGEVATGCIMALCMCIRTPTSLEMYGTMTYI